MIFKVHESGLTKITSENKNDKKLLWKLYDLIPENQKGCRPNHWLLVVNKDKSISLSVREEKALRNYIKKNILVKR